MHPLWQIKQVNTFLGQCHIDCNMAFGTCTTPHIWCMFFGLVMWIAIFVYLCPDLLHYMDDAWSYEVDPILIYYELYNCCFPHKQVKLLLYDELGLPSSKRSRCSANPLRSLV